MVRHSTFSERSITTFWCVLTVYVLPNLDKASWLNSYSAFRWYGNISPPTNKVGTICPVFLARICSHQAYALGTGILLQNWSDLLWEKIVLVIEENFWNSRLKAESFQKFWDHLNNLFKQWKVRTISGNIMLFKLVPGDFSDLKI